MSAPTFGTSDKLNLGSDWECQSWTETEAKSRATAVGNDGDVVASSLYNTIVSGTARYIYVGTATNLVTALTSAGVHVGKVKNGFLITGIEVDYSPCASGKRPVVIFTYRSGPTSDCAVYIPTITLPTFTNSTPYVPDLIPHTDADSEIQTCTYSLRSDFGFDLGADGEFLAGCNYGGEETISATYVGKPALTTTGWDVTSSPGTGGGETSNTSYDTYTYTFVKSLTRSTTTT
jgi:hypothetical protein